MSGDYLSTAKDVCRQAAMVPEVGGVLPKWLRPPIGVPPLE
ncbi:MAG: hypothetical protein WAO20_21010 [Acidobacteriota bacterium]